MIRQKNDELFLLFIPNLDPPQRLRAILLSLKTYELDNLVLEDMTIGGHPQPLDDPEIRIIFQAGHKIHAFCRQVAKELIIHKPPVKNDNRSRGKTKLFENRHLTNLPLADMHILGKIPLMIQKQMKFYRPFSPAKLCPVKKTGPKLNHSRIKAQ